MTQPEDPADLLDYLDRHLLALEFARELCDQEGPEPAEMVELRALRLALVSGRT